MDYLIQANYTQVISDLRNVPAIKIKSPNYGFFSMLIDWWLLYYIYL